MAEWLRNLVMMVVMLCWGSYITVNLIRHDPIDQFVWGIPGVIYYALNPTWRRTPGKKPDVTPEVLTKKLKEEDA